MKWNCKTTPRAAVPSGKHSEPRDFIALLGQSFTGYVCVEEKRFRAENGGTAAKGTTPGKKVRPTAGPSSTAEKAKALDLNGNFICALLLLGSPC
jgi:hypothetical protein